MPPPPDEPPRPEIQELSTPSELESFRPVWADLWSRDPRATPFQSPAWLIPWWRHFGAGELCTLASWDRDTGPPRLVGVLPLYVYTEPADRTRKMLPLGVATTDYLDGLFAPGFEHASLVAMWSHLNVCGDRWDEFELPQLRPTSPLLDPTAAPDGWSGETFDGDPCPAIALPAAVPRDLGQNVRYYRRRAENAGTLRFERADERNAEELFDALLTLHAARWAERGTAGVFADPDVRAALRMALPDLLRADLLRLYALRLDGRVIAASYGLIDPPRPRRRAYYYIGGFHPAYDQLSPGTLVIHHAVQEATHEGAAAFDFLRGRETYKYAWGAQDTPTFRRRFRHAPLAAERLDDTKLPAPPEPETWH
jgi:CelD/BcsL family acetyltransferase involved in cellulose biosynthesis